MAPKTNFGQLEQAIMEAVWRAETVTVRQVVDLLQRRRTVAYTTVMTVMNRLVARGCLKRRLSSSGAFVYVAVQSRADQAAIATKHSFDQLIHQYGDAALVQFLDQLDRLPDQKLQQLRQELRRRKKS